MDIVKSNSTFNVWDVVKNLLVYFALTWSFTPKFADLIKYLHGEYL